MGLCGSKLPEAERKKQKVLFLFENWHWAMEGELWREVAAENKDGGGGGSVRTFSGSQKYGSKGVKKEHFTTYSHSHVGFRQTEGKGFIDYTRTLSNGSSHTGVIRISFEGRFVQFTWLKDEVFSDMRGYLYANTASTEAWTYGDPVGLISELNIRGTFVARTGESGKFVLHRVEPGEESGSTLKFSSTKI